MAEIDGGDMKKLVLAICLLFSVSAPVAAVDLDPTYGIPRTDGLSVQEQEAFVERLSGLIDQLPPVKGGSTQTDIQNWEAEILPYTQAEGLALEITVPSTVTFFQYGTSLEIFHVLGSAWCNFGAANVDLNARMSNPDSSWYQREDFVWTLTHELIHMQGGPFCTGDSATLESNTQIATTEVLAAMVNSGNTAVLRPFLEGVRDMGLNSLEYYLPADTFRDEYVKVIHDPVETARLDKSLRDWASDPKGLTDILYKYSVIPWGKILDGLKYGNIPTIQVPTSSGTTALVFDDAKYLLGYPTLETLVAAVAGEK